MKILHLTPNYLPAIGGVEISTHEINKRLVKDGFEIEVVTQKEPNTPRYEIKDDVSIHRVSVFELLELRYRLGRMTPYMIPRIFQANFDILHAHSFGFFPTWVSLLSTKPVVITPHSDPSSKIYPLCDLLRAIPIRRADTIVALSEMERKHLIEQEVEPEKIVIIHNGVTLPPVKGKDIGIHPIILCMARADILHKGQDVTLQAMKKVHRSLPDVKLIMAGDGKDLPFLKAMARNLGLENCVKFTGFLHDADKWDYLSSCDVLSIAPRMEPFGVVYLEAMAYGRPIVTTNVGGIREVVDDCAVLVPPNNPGLLAAALIQVLTDKKLAQTLGQKGLGRVQSYNWDNLVQKYKALYESLIETRNNDQ